MLIESKFAGGVELCTMKYTPLSAFGADGRKARNQKP
jgi:hypothetical protein